MELSFWCFSVFLHLVFPSVTPAYLEIVPDPSSAVAGQDVTMNCMFEQSYDSKRNEILWEFSKDLKQLLTVWSSKQQSDQNQHFRGRTKVEFVSKKASLTLQNISVLDSGMYRCIVITSNYEQQNSNFVELKVSAPYSPPVITVLNKTDKLFLQCTSNGGHPEGDVVWHYKNGSKLIELASTQHISNGMGGFNISSNIALRLQNDADICCKVINTVMQKNWTTCTDGTAQQQRYHYMAAVAVSVAFAVVCLLLTLVMLHKCKSREREKIDLGRGHSMEMTLANGQNSQTNDDVHEQSTNVANKISEPKQTSVNATDF